MHNATDATDATLAMARQVLASQPFSTLLGTTVHAFGGTQAELRLEVRDDLRQQNGFVHGGVLSYLADNALTFAGGLALGPCVVTGEFKINYVRPARRGILAARATACHASRTQAHCRCEVFELADGTERLVALAQGTIHALPAQDS